jgi:hypothetical protein
MNEKTTNLSPVAKGLLLVTWSTECLEAVMMEAVMMEAVMRYK